MGGSVGDTELVCVDTLRGGKVKISKHEGHKVHKGRNKDSTYFWFSFESVVPFVFNFRGPV